MHWFKLPLQWAAPRTLGLRVRRSMMFFLLALMPSVIFGTEPLDRFLGKYEGYSRACWNSHLILTQERVSLDECRDKPFTILQRGEKSVSIELAQDSSCEFTIMSFELRSDDIHGIGVYGFRNRSDFDKNQYQSYCWYYRERSVKEP